MSKNEFNSNTLKYLKILSLNYPNIQTVSTEIINLRAILNLPKGTEHYISDIHGEYEGFRHILRNASGSVRRKINQTLGDYVSASDRKALATLIYYPELKLNQLKEQKLIDKDWYTITLKHLIAVCNITTSKYTQSKVRKALPKNYDYIINELLTTGSKDFNKEDYYNQIINSIIEVGSADSFIIAMCHLVHDMVIDKLHIVGDIYDRGANPHLVLDELENQRYVDVQWGNHDILWMGAAAGNKCCIANAVRICLRYNNYDFLEDGYGINIRPLSMFASEKYKNDPCLKFIPKHTNTEDSFNYKNDDIIAKMHKAISIIQFKLEGQNILAHPEYFMDDRLILDKINIKNGTVKINGTEYPLSDASFPTIDPLSPYTLTADEQKIIDGLYYSFINCEKLKRHTDFLFKNGSIYKHYNNCLLFHGCIPMNENGEFKSININGKNFFGKDLLDKCEALARQGFYGDKQKKEGSFGLDFMWYLWCGPTSPLFGKDKMATFERYFLNDREIKEEHSDPYFKFAYSEKTVSRILNNFGINDDLTVIVNGHVPVKSKLLESPVKANGKLITIDGGISKAYQPVTGIAGYTLVSNSHEMVISEHEPFTSLSDIINNNVDMHSRTIPVLTYKERMTISDTDDGKEIISKIQDLELLLKAYYAGVIKQRKN